MVGGYLVVGATPAWTAPQTHTQSFGYTAGTQSWTVPAGVTSIEVEIRGAGGGNGGADATPAPDPGTYRGLVTGRVSVTPGASLTIAVGQGGATGQSQKGGSVAAAVGGLNPLAGYDGGAGGRTGTAGSSGQGGAGGAASVLRIGSVDIVAGGGGGNGGSGQYAPTKGRPADGAYVPRTVTPSATDGQAGINAADACAASTCSNDDGGGSGGGGGGEKGGAQGRIEFGAGTSNEWFGYGGSVGGNSTGGLSGLSTSYEYLSSNGGSGAIVIRYQTGPAAAPTAPQGVAGVASAALNWVAPAEIGQGPIQGYEIQYSTNGGTTWSSSIATGSDATEFTVPGLTNGVGHVFRVAAVTPAGTGEFSPASATITPYALPSAPVITGLEPRDGALALTFTAPSAGAPPTGYQYRVDGGAWTPLPGGAQPVLVSGLTNGVAAQIELRATSVVGFGAVSDPATGTPQAVPGAPNITEVTSSIGTGTVAFTPGFDGGSPITGYEYRVEGGAWQSLGSAGPLELTGLGNGTSTRVEIRAVNAVGPGTPSLPVIVTTPATPGPLVNASATGLDGAVSVGFQLGLSGGSPITSVQYSLDDGTTWHTTGTTGPLTVSGLPNGSAQSVKLRAVNAIGPGPSVSVSATPASVPSAPSITNIEDNDAGALELAFAPPASDGGSAITGYQYTTDGGATWRNLSGTVSPATVTETSDGAPLDHDTEYTFAIRAVNGVGAGPASAGRTETGPVPVPVPSAPTIDAVTSQPGALKVSFTPGDNGSVPVDGYEYSIDGGDTWVSTGGLNPQFVITGLTDGTAYGVRVRAVNVSGAGLPSAPVSGTPASAPAAPTLTTITRSDGALTLQLTHGANGGSPLTGVEYTIDGGDTWHSAGTTGTTFTITGLNNGQGYGVQARDLNSVGRSSGSNQLYSAPAAPPPAPALTLTPGDTTVQVQAVFASDGGAPLTRVEYSIDGGDTWVDTHSISGSFLLTGLTNGTPVNVRVRGVNAIGNGGIGSETATPRTLPGAPVDVSVVGNTSSADVSWSAPISDGGSAVTGYRATAYASAASVTPLASCTTTGATSCSIPGLTNGTAYYIAVSATNAVGTGPDSQPRVVVTPLQRPSAPTLTSITRGDQWLRVAFTPGANGGQTITGYEYTIDGGTTWLPASGSSSPITVSGLTNGTNYTVRLRAITAAGPSPASNALSGVPYGYPLAPTNITAVPQSGGAVVSWTPADLNGNTLSQYTVTAFTAASGGTVAKTCTSTGTSCTLTGLSNGTTYYVSIQTEATQSGVSGTLYSERSDPRVPVTPRTAGTAPTFGTPTRTVDGYTVQITNYSAVSSYTATPPAGTSATVSGTGLLTVTGVAPGASATVSVTVARSGYLDASAPVTGSALSAGVAPTFGTPVRTADGYTVQITNYDATSGYSLDTLLLPAGAAASRSGGTITVTGLAPGASAWVGATVSRAGSTNASGGVSGTALDAGVAPTFGAPTRTADGYTVEIANYDPSAGYALDESSLPAGAAATRLGDTITVTGLEPGASGTVGVTVSRPGRTDASAQVAGSALDAGAAPTFGAPSRAIDGYTVEIANFDAAATYALDESSLPSGASATRSGSTITVTGLEPGESGTVGVTVSRPGRTDASAPVTGSALSAGVAPTFGTPVRTADGYTVEIANYDPSASYALDESSLPAGAAATRSGDTITVTGLEPGESGTVGVTVSRAGSTDASAPATGTALDTGAAPTFGTPVPTVDGYTVQIANYDPSAGYALDESSLPAGAAATRSGDTITVTGLDPSASGTVGVTVSRPDRTDASASIAGSALDAGIVPTFGVPVPTVDGYTVEITNYDPSSTYLFDPPPGATVVRAGSFLVVSGLAPEQTATIGVRVQHPGAAEASGSVTGTAQKTGTAPRLSKPVPTAHGFELRILNYDPDLDYTVTTTAGHVTRDGDRIIVTGLEPGEEAIVIVSSSNGGTAEATSAVSGAAAPADGTDPPGDGDGDGDGNGGGDDSDGLADTGAPVGGWIGLLAALLLGASGGVLLIRRRRA